jgi:hypothetical protein
MLSFITFGLFAQETSNSQFYQAGISFSSLNSFGLHYKTGGERTMLRMSLLTMNLGLGGEITPGIQYSLGKTKTTYASGSTKETKSSFNFGFNSNSASLSVAYRFGK